MPDDVDVEWDDEDVAVLDDPLPVIFLFNWAFREHVAEIVAVDENEMVTVVFQPWKPQLGWRLRLKVPRSKLGDGFQSEETWAEVIESVQFHYGEKVD